MKDLNPTQPDHVAGGVEPQHYETQLAPDPQQDPILIDYNPDRTPK